MMSSIFNLTVLRRYQQRFIHLLLLAALFQALLPMLLTPSVVQDADGNSTVICTLQGLQTLDLDGEHSSTSANNPCPACTLSHASAAPLPTQQLTLSAAVYIASFQQPEHHPEHASTPAYFQAPSRAPPIA